MSLEERSVGLADELAVRLCSCQFLSQTNCRATTDLLEDYPRMTSGGPPSPTEPSSFDQKDPSSKSGDYSLARERKGSNISSII